MERKSFRGGIQISSQKHMTKIKLTDELPVSNRLFFRISQQPAHKCRLLVKVGDQVTVGQLIAEPLTINAVPVHAAVNGIVEQVSGESGDYSIVVIKSVGEEHDFQPEVERNPHDMTDEQLLDALLRSGVSGMTGNLYSSRFKGREGEPTDYLLINGAESEPYLTSDYHQLLDHSYEVIAGALIFKRIYRAKRCIIGIQEEYSLAVKEIVSRLNDDEQIEVVTLPAKYPQGAVPILIKAITDRDMGRGLSPIDIGCAVIGIDAAFAAWEAAVYDKPVIERLMTVNGTRVTRPGNFMIRMGTPVEHVLATCGIRKNDTVVVLGGLMTGKMITDLQTPIGPQDSGVLIFGSGHLRLDTPYENCVRCGKCVYCCPVRLYPNQLSYMGEKKDYAGLTRWNLLDCMECGSCVYICPSNRPTLKFVREAKIEIRQMESNTEQDNRGGA